MTLHSRQAERPDGESGYAFTNASRSCVPCFHKVRIGTSQAACPVLSYGRLRREGAEGVLRRSNRCSASPFAVLLWPIHSNVCQLIVTLFFFLALASLEIPRSWSIERQSKDWAKTQVGVVFASYGLMETLWEALLCRSR
jgi:hypothetical protein